METLMNETPKQMNEKNSRRNMKMIKFNKLFKNQKGMTLIELLAVIVILGIVAAIAVPAIGNIINNSKDKAILADASSILSGAKVAATDGVCTTATESNVTVITCDKSKLAGYVEGITLAEGDQVVKRGNDWTVTYNKLSTIKNVDRFTAGNFTPKAAAETSVSEIDLNALLQK